MRDTMRQGVLDLMNLNASLGAMDADADGGADMKDDFDVTNVTFIGHSLGAITGTTFVAMNNDSNVQTFRTDLPEIKTVILANPGAQLPKLLENSPSFAPRILPGLYAAAGLSQGDVDLEKFFIAFQATIDSVDPVSFAKKLVDDGTPVLMFEIAGDGAANPSDTVVPVNATDAQILDLTSTPPMMVDRAPSAFGPLVGTIGLTSQMGLTPIDASTVTTPVTGAAVQALTKFTKGTHGSFGGGDDDKTVFAEMMAQTITFILSNGMQAVAKEETVLEAAPAP
jgi:pimeloyl-ACP methyl ester carboxylesterase